jgi:sugar phosphate isomerase/epimerase
MGIKGRFPFRAGATSYVLEADMLTNVKHLAGRVDDIELLVFESDAMAELPDPAMLHELDRIARPESLTYTVHLPLDIRLGAADPEVRSRSVEKCAHTIERMRIVNPVAWILHCDRQAPGDKALPDHEWAGYTEQSLRALLASGIEPETVCVETLDGNFPLLEPMIRKSGVSVCFDIGHLILYGLDIFGYLERFGDRARVVHLHGVVDGKDHRSLNGVPRMVLEKVVSTRTEITGNPRVMTMELFNAGDFEESLAIMEGLAPCTA